VPIDSFNAGLQALCLVFAQFAQMLPRRGGALPGINLRDSVFVAAISVV